MCPGKKTDPRSAAKEGATRMRFYKIQAEGFAQLMQLQRAYKAEIGECAPTEAELKNLQRAIEEGQIQFYGCACGDELVACCSICVTYSTFQYGKSGILEDFYICPAHRHRGIARKLVAFAREQSGVGALTVGCADCDVQMYQAIGFRTRLGNLLAFEA